MTTHIPKSMSAQSPPEQPDDLRLTLIAESYARLLGRSLIPPSPNLRETLWHSPIAIVAHGTEADPQFFYGNRQALTLFEMDFKTFTRLPSRFSAEPVLREERALLLDRVTRDGFIDNYAGIRVSSSGRRFRIEQAVVWNLIDTAGGYHGQAAAFEHWVPVR